MSCVSLMSFVALVLLLATSVADSANSPQVASRNGVKIEASPNQIYVELTDQLTVNCTCAHEQNSNFSTIVSLILSKTTATNSSTYRELASITAFSDVKVQEKDTMGAHVTSNHMADQFSFICLEWTDPSRQVAGKYRCEAHGMDKGGHFLTAIADTVVEEKVAGTSAILGKVKEMSDGMNELDRKNKEIDSKVNALDMKNKEMNTKMNTMEANDGKVDSKLKETEIKMNATDMKDTEMEAKMKKMEKKINETDILDKEMGGKMKEMERQMNETDINDREMNAKIKKMEANMKETERELNETDIKETEMDATMEEMERAMNATDEKDKERDAKMKEMEREINEMHIKEKVMDATMEKMERAMNATDEKDKERDAKMKEMERKMSEMDVKEKETERKLNDFKKRVDDSISPLLHASTNDRGRHYLLSKKTSVYVFEANRLCQLHGGYLAEVNDWHEFYFLANFVHTHSYDYTYAMLGASDEGHDGRWTFLTSRTGMSTLVWANHEPDGGTTANCLFLGAGMQRMYDGQCHEYSSSWEVRFLCEVPD
ncbi:girdin [Aplysia californica]|uniref:Girdin n=1 Tax=Aplysia californica TaxID=6500 RepID=A0ABM0K987_APLCA|nr:girdin [Aplysia californica]